MQLLWPQVVIIPFTQIQGTISDLSWLSFLIVIARIPGIYGSKRTESEDGAKGQGLFTLQ